MSGPSATAERIEELLGRLDESRAAAAGGAAVAAPDARAAPARPGLRVAAVMDEFSRLAFSPEFDYVAIGPDDWGTRLEAEPPSMVLVESAWRGNDARWKNRVSRSREAHGDLIRLVEWARRRDIPAVFWNKEDPANFDRFQYSAALFDHVFTTDADCVPAYRKLTGHDRVHVLPFAAQPSIHNPIAVPPGRDKPVAFAGTYYAEKHPDRQVQMEAVLDAARDFGLEIFSRVVDDPKFAYPDKYVPHIVGSLPYEELVVAHKRYKVFLNVNSVVRSRTMCARRIFELLAAGAAVVSGSSPAIASVVGPGLISESSDADHTRAVLRAILADDDARERQAVRGIRTVLAGHTYGQRVETICRTVGIDADVAPPTAAVVACPQTRDEALRVLAAVSLQRRQPDEVVLVVPSGAGADLPALDGLRVFEVGEDVPAAARLRLALHTATADHVALLSPSAAYGTDFLGDLLLTFAYADAEIVGKRSVYATPPQGGAPVLTAPGAEFAPARDLDPGTLVLRRDAVHLADLRDEAEEPLAPFLTRGRVRGLRLFAADRFNYVAGHPRVELPGVAIA